MTETFDVEVLFSYEEQDEAAAMIAAMTALSHKVECTSIVFVPSMAGTKQPGNIEMISYSIEIARVADGRM
jgi:hypothetical protein